MFICGPSKGKKHKKCRMTKGSRFHTELGFSLIFTDFTLFEKKLHQLAALDPCKSCLGDCSLVDACSAAWAL